MVTVLGLLAANFAGRVRRWYLGCFTAGLIVLVLVSRTFTNLGHLMAWLLGLGLSVLVTRSAQAARAAWSTPAADATMQDSHAR